jgi:hypothetical protein
MSTLINPILFFTFVERRREGREKSEEVDETQREKLTN